VIHWADGEAGAYHKLTAAINHAKDHGDLPTLRKIAEDPHRFILRRGADYFFSVRV
jgi:hypothetical protein